MRRSSRRQRQLLLSKFILIDPVLLARPFPFGLPLPPGYAPIAITPATVRPAHDAAIVEVARGENGVIGELVAANKKRKLVQTPDFVKWRA